MDEITVKKIKEGRKKMVCAHCGSDNYRKNGKYKGVQRFKCRECDRYFREKAKKFTYADKAKAVDFYLSNGGMKRTAKYIGCPHEMVEEWVREFADDLRGKLQKVSEKVNEKNLPLLVDMNEIGARGKKKEWSQYGLLILGNKLCVLHLPSNSQ